MPSDERRRRSAPPPVHPVLDRLTAYSWRLVVVAIAGWGTLRVLDALRLVVFPVVVALLLSLPLAAGAHWLRRRGVPRLAATWAVFLGFLATAATAVALVVPPLSDEFGRLGPTIDDAVDQVETWLVEDSPFDIDRGRLDDLRQQVVDAARRSVASPGGLALRSAVLLAEIVAGILLSLVLAFFFVKDGERFQRTVLDMVPAERRDLTVRLTRRAWQTLGGYLRGAAMLGTVESVVMGITLTVVGAGLVVPVMVLTFAAAFVPFLGAIVAGVIAVLVTLVTSGSVAALIVAGVALAVQQLDNDLLAPVVYGKALELHPVVILLAVSAGGALAGIAGAFLAVPVTATVVNVLGEARRDIGQTQA